MLMPQLHFYLPEDVAKQVRENAEQLGQSTSSYVASIVKEKIQLGWPEGYFESFGSGDVDINLTDDSDMLPLDEVEL